MAFAFSNLISSINDIEPVVAQKAVTLIETLSENSIKAIIYCLELQFDCVLLDRPHIIKILLILYSVSPNQSILSWDFFLQRFSTLSIENQFKADILTITDITGGGNSNNNKSFQRKILIARFASKKSNLIKQITHDLSGFTKNTFKSSINESFSHNKYLTNFEIALLDLKKSSSTEPYLSEDEGDNLKLNKKIESTNDSSCLNDQILHSFISLLMKVIN